MEAGETSLWFDCIYSFLTRVYTFAPRLFGGSDRYKTCRLMYLKLTLILKLNFLVQVQIAILLKKRRIGWRWCDCSNWLSTGCIILPSLLFTIFVYHLIFLGCHKFVLLHDHGWRLHSIHFHIRSGRS